MADKKISELPYISGGQISGNTLVPLVTYFSAVSGNTVHTYVSDLENYLTSGITVSGNYLPLSGGTVTGSTSFQSGLTATTISATTYLNLPQFSGGSGNCINDFYVSNIHSCSPLRINPLNEGNVYFGLTSGITIDLTNTRLGIGTETPSANLDVSGKIKTTNFQMTSGATNGYVLTSDASGNASWQTSSGGSFISGNRGAFLSTQDQIIASAGQLKSVSADTTVVSSGITLSANTRYIISNVGNYNIQYTVQVQKTSPVLSNTYIWMQKNGTDIANSTTITTLTGDTIFRVVTKNFIETVTTPNTYYELYWTSDDNDTQLGKETTPPYGIPASPSVYVTINQI